MNQTMIAISVAALFLSSVALAYQSEPVVVSQVLKGDTMIVARQGHLGSDGGTGLYVTLVGVDAPELDQPGGTESRNYLQTIALNQSFEMVIVSQTGNHALVRMYSGSKDLGAQVLQNGWGFYRASDASGLSAVENASFKQLAETAKYNKIGLWKNGNFNSTITAESYRSLQTYRYHQQYTNGTPQPNVNGFDRPTLNGQPTTMPMSAVPQAPAQPSDWRTWKPHQ